VHNVRAHGCTVGQLLWKETDASDQPARQQEFEDLFEELGFSQGEIIRVLGYKSRNAVSNIEVGIEGLPAKRAYAWADVLELPRDAFFRFVTGEADRVVIPNAAARQPRLVRRFTRRRLSQRLQAVPAHEELRSCRGFE
jgi:hypothetical protein